MARGTMVQPVEACRECSVWCSAVGLEGTVGPPTLPVIGWRSHKCWVACVQ